MKEQRADGTVGMAAAIQLRLSLSSHLLSNMQIKVHRTEILPVILYGCET